jgi:DNA-binding NarL/FixJ family response regulator
MILTMERSVLVVDDDAAFRRLAVRMLTAAGLVVVGEAATAADANAAAATLKPDAALVDVMLAGDDGIALAGELTALPWSPRVLLTSTDADAASASEVERSRARAFVPKSELPGAPLLRLFFDE